MTQDDAKWFFSWLAGPQSTAEARKGVICTEAKWPLGSVIGVSFLDGAAALQNAVMKYAEEWLTRAGAFLTFQRVPAAGDIRVSFSLPGSWSAVGTTCLEIKDANEPTMNFGWLQDADAAEARRVVLHEFGHALGLLHEHQSPVAEIEWDKRRVVEDLQASHGWSIQEIERNLFVPVARQGSQFTEFDPRSIMIYPIPKRWLRRGAPVGLNADLSSHDVAFIKAQYPRDPNPERPDGPATEGQQW